MSRPDLAGHTFVITRPAHQAEPLCRLIEQHGGRALRMPLLQIAPPDARQQSQLDNLLARIDRYHMAIFISPNAVDFGIQALSRHGGLPATLKTATVGRGSARTLAEKLGREPDIYPDGPYDSETLLALEPMQQVDGRRIVILRGNGGRETLAETLRQRGARVDYAEVYRRLPPTELPDAFFEAGRQGAITAIALTSSESLTNLYDRTEEERNWLMQTPLVVVSRRSAERAAELGFSRITLAPETSDQGLFKALVSLADAA